MVLHVDSTWTTLLMCLYLLGLAFVAVSCFLALYTSLDLQQAPVWADLMLLLLFFIE